MTDELEEQRILSVLAEGMDVDRIDEGGDSWTKLWVAADWINRLAPEDQAAFATTILSNEKWATIWLAFLLARCRTMDEQFERIVDGIPFEHDGEMYQAVPTMEGAVQ